MLCPKRIDSDIVCRVLSILTLLFMTLSAASRTWSEEPGTTELREDLARAIRSGDHDEVRSLLDRVGALDEPIRFGLTALDMARILGDRALVDLLVEKGADPKREVPAPEKAAGQILDAAIQEATIDGVTPALAVLVSRAGKVVFRRAGGLEKTEPRVPATEETKFRVGSVSKQFTAAAILWLAEKNKLELGDPLSKFMPDFPRGDEVTIRQLLTHTSGIKSYTDKPGFIDRVKDPIKPLELIAWFQDDPRDFEPGEGWHYNNSGYFLLGHLVGVISGMPLGEFLEKTFFKPLGMKDTGIHRRGESLDHEAIGMAFAGEKIETALDWDMTWAGGAGALYSTVGDLFRWNEAVFGGRVLSRATLDEAFTPVEVNGESKGYGYGWAISELRGLRQIAHGGGLHGFLSMLLRFPQQQLTVTVLLACSPAPPGVSPEALARALSELFLWREMKPRPKTESFKGDGAALDAYVGQYDYGRAILTVTRERKRLFAQLTGQPKFEIHPSGEDAFVWRVVDARVTFLRDEKGKVTHALHKQGGAEFRAPRLARREVVKLDGKTFDRYVAEYTYPGGAVLSLTREGDRFFAQLTGQPRLEILPSSPTGFFWKDVNARLRILEEDGKVTGVEHSQGGRTFTAPRR